MRSAGSEVQIGRLQSAGTRFELADLLATVRERDPLTFPETIAVLPPGLQDPGPWRLVLVDHPCTVLWDGLSESAAILLVRLFETQQLVLLACHPELYELAARRVELPAVTSIPAVPRQVCWLPCTISRGPLVGLNSTHKIGFHADDCSN